MSCRISDQCTCGNFSDSFAPIYKLHKAIMPITEYVEPDEALVAT